MSENPTSPGRYAWTVVMLLFPVALLNYLDRQMIASMKTSVMQDITSIGSETNWGYMLGQFKWVYAFFSPIGGYIADRFSRKYTITGSLVVWSAITWYTGQVQSYQELLWTRTAMGVSEAFYIPAALAMIADYHTGGTRSRAVGVHQTGIYCGVMIGGFAGFVNEWPDFGWRGAFDYTGLAGILYAVPLLLLLRDVPRVAAAAPVETEPQALTMIQCFIRAVLRILSDFWELLRNRSFILLVLYFTLPAVAAWVVRDWMPAILQKEFNISQGIAGMSASIYWQAAAIGSAMLGGWLADRRMKSTPRGRIQVSALGMILIVPALFGVGNAPAMHSFGLAIASLVLFGIGWGFFDINNMPILSQIARPQLRATGYGIMNFVSMFSGGLADWGFGRLNDMKVPLNVSFGLFASLCIVSVVIVLMIKPKEQH